MSNVDDRINEMLLSWDRAAMEIPQMEARLKATKARVLHYEALASRLRSELAALEAREPADDEFSAWARAIPVLVAEIEGADALARRLYADVDTQARKIAGAKDNQVIQRARDAMALRAAFLNEADATGGKQAAELARGAAQCRQLAEEARPGAYERHVAALREEDEMTRQMHAAAERDAREAQARANARLVRG